MSSQALPTGLGCLQTILPASLSLKPQDPSKEATVSGLRVLPGPQTTPTAPHGSAWSSGPKPGGMEGRHMGQRGRPGRPRRFLMFQSLLKSQRECLGHASWKWAGSSGPELTLLPFLLRTEHHFSLRRLPGLEGGGQEDRLFAWFCLLCLKRSIPATALNKTTLFMDDQDLKSTSFQVNRPNTGEFPADPLPAGSHQASSFSRSLGYPPPGAPVSLPDAARRN